MTRTRLNCNWVLARLDKYYRIRSVEKEDECILLL
ncbi:hypothetical protein PSEEN4587 [Pseudomonas entomophila L48]|uniref:Uncharacterized protein n=1 Tax=Pseudomonas entomophila (strain L48) TaxID=384676 RepID=Q1I519_PSEE4|nr:hypothetical protein PSEEN4587 [Pseudomonas entomophila L48]